MAGPGRSRLSGGSILPGGTRSLDAAGEEDPEARPGWARGGRGVPATAERVLAMEAPSGGGGGDLLLALAAGLSAPPPGTWQFGDSMFPRGPHAESPPPQHVESYLQHRAGEGSRERDAGMAQDERSYSANHGDFLESKAGCASTALSVRRADSSSSVGTGAGVSIHRVCAQLDIVANLDQTSSSSHSDHSEMSPTEGQKENHPEEFSLLKLQTKDGQRPEWTFYPRFSSNIHTYHVGKQCLFNGVFLGNRRSLSERTVDTCLGRKKYDIDSRNGIPKLTPGDNPYMSPEQSKDFHKAGSTLPPVNFSIVPYVKKFDTFIPLEPLPQSPNLPFWVKEKANNLRNEITEVEELHKWQPAVSLANSLFASGALDFPRQS
ncbi:spermatogenesis-associated serine-rich protein 1 isoform X2 [Oryctolagus cuniculus]|uniref:spermatogenesis-associated serine-rich protein 1 isoform X2 n=1 Tax=Oryctolagus cuniculus TaxID=9986 RepID=UPI00387A576D